MEGKSGLAGMMITGANDKDTDNLLQMNAEELDIYTCVMHQFQEAESLCSHLV